MNNKIREAFQNIHAEETLKEKTKHNLANYQPKPKWHLAWVSACGMCVLCIGVFYYLYFTPIATISVDINPSIELEINRFDKVIHSEGFNEDGVLLLEDLDVTHQDYTDVLEDILNNDRIVTYLSQDEELSITVVDNDQERGERILNKVQTCVQGHQNVHCQSLQHKEVEKAHEMGLSHGKYQAYQILYELDSSITIQEIQTMTMREIQTRIDELTNKTEALSNEQSHHEKRKQHKGKKW